MEAHEKRIALLCRSETSCRYDPSCCGIASNRWNEGKHFHEKGKATTSFDFLCRYDVCRQHLWMRRWVLWWFTVVQVVLGLNIDIVTTLPWRFHLDSLLNPLSKGVGRTGTFLALYKLWLDYHNPACKKWVLLLSWFILIILWIISKVCNITNSGRPAQTTIKYGPEVGEESLKLCSI